MKQLILLIPHLPCGNKQIFVRFISSSRDDILLTCKLLQRHFMNNDDNLDESKLVSQLDYDIVCELYDLQTFLTEFVPFFCPRGHALTNELSSE